MLHTQNQASTIAAKRRSACFISVAATLTLGLLSLTGCGGSGVAALSDQNGFIRSEVTRSETTPEITTVIPGSNTVDSSTATPTPSPTASASPEITGVPIEIDK